MLPSSNRGSGMNMGFPDPCPTIAGPAVVVVPYPNQGLHAQAMNFSPNVKTSGMNSLHMGSMLPMTNLDEGGTASPQIKGPGKFTMGCPGVLINAQQAIHLTCPTTGNNMTNGLGAVLVPGDVTVLYCLREEEGDRAGERVLEVTPPRTELLAPDVGYLEVGAIHMHTASLVESAWTELVARGARALILDLRPSPGGDVVGGLRLAEAFLEAGAPMAIERSADGDERVHASRRPDPMKMSVVVLVGPRTASTAEVFASALQDRGRAVLVGGRTFGKGRAERLGGVDGAVGYRPVAEFVRSTGAPIEGVGVSPDMDVDDDTALEAAFVIASLET